MQFAEGRNCNTNL